MEEEEVEDELEEAVDDAGWELDEFAFWSFELDFGLKKMTFPDFKLYSLMYFSFCSVFPYSNNKQR